MKHSQKDKLLPEVSDLLKHLGGYIRIARKRRKMTMGEVAQRLNLGYQTIVRLERGDPNVSVAAYMSVLWLFDLGRQFSESVHPERDATGKDLEISRLPQRVRHERKGVTDDF